MADQKQILEDGAIRKALTELDPRFFLSCATIYSGQSPPFILDANM
jgi:hypothetical protein